ncbi:TetR/AcrR family transcriptional regulator [Pantoea ananatis]|uniref:TetR/AcrR family transcriptional regulator n=1 Tax=Pantoea ananas TaxID=553 RepID=UPI001F4E68A3|nr:TetR/AcrR family transcriptional regulator [Pantoea ananatis]MCH9271898.1 TetR/AcrR family transcriptional regulator [Pantoea ananatis]
MARPLSQEKRIAILDAAICVIATQGLAATTSLIAKEAGVSTGSLFTYYPDKVTLLNQVYLYIKSDMARSLMEVFPLHASLREKNFHIWQSYIRWACSHPNKHYTLQQLNASHIVTDTTRQQSLALFDAINHMLIEIEESDICQSVAFVTAIMASLAEAVIAFSMNEPEKTDTYISNGFTVFWRGLGF